MLKVVLAGMISSAVLVDAARALAACPQIRVTPQVVQPPNGRGSFTVLVQGGPQRLTYKWKLSGATIINGEGQALIIVKGKGKVTASVDIGGLETGCPYTAEATADFP